MRQFSSHLLSGTTILIAGGFVPGAELSSTYLMKIDFEDEENEIKDVRFRMLPDYPTSFYYACFGNYCHRSFIMGGYKSNGQCCEFHQDKYFPMPALNSCRSGAASTSIQDKLIVTGGYGDYEILEKMKYFDSIEILNLMEKNTPPTWIEYPSALPYKVWGHTLVTLNKKLYLIGGDLEGTGRCDLIWEGCMDTKTNIIEWKKMGIHLKHKRSCHFSFVISNSIIIYGGSDVEDDVVEIIQGDIIKSGPPCPFGLSSFNDQAILDRCGRIIITSNTYDCFILYDYENGTFKHYPNAKLLDNRNFYVALVQ